MPVEVLEGINYPKLVQNISFIYVNAQEKSKKSVNSILVESYWQIGRLIAQVEQEGKLRAKHGDRLIENLSEDLCQKHGNGFSPTNLRYMRKFYQSYPSFQQAPAELGWTNCQTLSAIPDKEAREHYGKQALTEKWTTRDLKQALKEDAVELEEMPEEAIDITPPEENELITLKRGRLNAKIITTLNCFHDGQPTLMVDCGFSNYKYLHQLEKEGFKNGQVVQALSDNSVKDSDVSTGEVYTYPSFVERVVDGDTLLCQIDLGFGLWTRQRLRLRGVNCSELADTRGQKAKSFVENIVKGCDLLVVKTYKSDKYDRYLTDVFFLPGTDDAERVAGEGRFLNNRLLEEGLAVRA